MKKSRRELENDIEKKYSELEKLKDFRLYSEFLKDRCSLTSQPVVDVRLPGFNGEMVKIKDWYGNLMKDIRDSIKHDIKKHLKIQEDIVESLINENS